MNNWHEGKTRWREEREIDREVTILTWIITSTFFLAILSVIATTVLAIII